MSPPTIHTSTATSDSDSEHYLQDSGYQTRAPSPRDDTYKKQTSFTGVDSIAAPISQNISSSPRSFKPSNITIQLVREMLSEIIEIPIIEVGPNASLDDLSVDSLLATEIVTEIKKRFGVSVTQAQFLECSDVSSLALCIRPNGTSPSSEQIEGPAEDRVDGDVTVNSAPDSLRQENFGRIEDSYEQYDIERRNLAVSSYSCFQQAKSSYDHHAESTGFAKFCTEVYPLQSQLVVQYVVSALVSLGCDLRTLTHGDEVPTFQFDPKHTKLVPQLHKILIDSGLIEKSGRGGDSLFRRSSLAVPTVPASTLNAEMLQEYPKHASETKLLHTTAPRLADCLTGVADPIGLIFRDSAARELLEDVYTNAPMFKTGTLLLAGYLSSIVERCAGSEREIRILELGAGTGGTTKHIIETLTSLGTGCKFSYTFTDLSASLVKAAKRKFAKWSFMRYATLDIEKEPSSDFLGAYDIILSTNCIHATKNLVHSTTNIRKMLRTDGLLCLVELTRNLFWFDLVFGLLEGWWLFNDGREHALAHERRWEQDLSAAGFKWIDWSDSTSAESDILRVITASPFKVEPSPATESQLPNGITNGLSTHDATLEQTIAYKNVEGLEVKADIYYPPPEAIKAGGSLPVALMIHRGGHIMSSRKDIRPEQTQMLLKSGFLPISVDYRLCPEKTLLEGPMADVADALAWIQTVLPSLTLARSDIQVDGERVVAVGWSAGGHLAMTLAWTSLAIGVGPPNAILAFYCPTDYKDPFWTKPNVPIGSELPSATDLDHQPSSLYDLSDEAWCGISEHPITSYNIPPAKRALGGWLARSDPRSLLALYMNWHGRTLHVLLNGLDKKRRAEPPSPSLADVVAVSPLAQIRREGTGKYTTPTFIIHPRDDDLIPWQQAERTWQSLQEGGIDTDLRIVEDVPHLFDMYRGWQKNEDARKAVVEGYEFLCRYAGVSFQG